MPRRPIVRDDNGTPIQNAFGYDTREVLTIAVSGTATYASFSQEVDKIVLCNVSDTVGVYVLPGAQTVTTTTGFYLPPKALLPLPLMCKDVAAITAAGTSTLKVLGLL